MKNSNILESWYSQALVLSSPLNIYRFLDRNRVELIYNSLKQFFGENYFSISKAEYSTSIEKVSWLYSLLSAPENVGCISALVEVVNLIEYSKTLEDSLRKELVQLIESPQNLRSFFFELYVYKRLDDLSIPNKKKIQIGSQIIEGTCRLFGKEYLFECKKVFMPNMKQIDLYKRLMTEFAIHGSRLKRGHGLICTVIVKPPLRNSHHFSLAQKIKAFFDHFNGFNYIQKVDYYCEDDLGSFRAVDFDNATYLETTQKNEYSVLFCLIPPFDPVPGIPNTYQGIAKANYFISENSIYKKLERVLEEKTNQHKNSVYANKILFIDSETFPEFCMGLFQYESMFKLEKVEKIYRKLKLKDIVCIIRRKYLQAESNVLVDVLCPNEHKEVGEFLKQAFCN